MRLQYDFFCTSSVATCMMLGKRAAALAAKLFVHMPHPVTVASTPFHELVRLPSSSATNGYFSLPSSSLS